MALPRHGFRENAPDKMPHTRRQGPGAALQRAGGLVGTGVLCSEAVGPCVGSVDQATAQRDELRRLVTQLESGRSARVAFIVARLARENETESARLSSLRGDITEGPSPVFGAST